LYSHFSVPLLKLPRILDLFPNQLLANPPRCSLANPRRRWADDRYRAQSSSSSSHYILAFSALRSLLDCDRVSESLPRNSDTSSPPTTSRQHERGKGSSFGRDPAGCRLSHSANGQSYRREEGSPTSKRTAPSLDLCSVSTNPVPQSSRQLLTLLAGSGFLFLPASSSSTNGSYRL